MRFLEITLLLLGIFLPFLIDSKKIKINHKIFLGLIVGTLILHALLEGIRWQMSPIYLINVIVIICLIRGYAYFKGNWFRKMTSGIFLLLMIVIGFSLSNVLPVFDFPTPTGDYQVGSQYLHLLTDAEESLTKKIGDKRELMIKVWYPADIADEEKETYLDEGERVGFATKYGLPKNIFNYLDQIETNTFVNPAVASGKFPVLLFSHGYYSNATGYYALLEEIVSRGYIVLNINHTYESVGALFPSGEIKLYNSEYDKQHNNEEMAAMVWQAMENFKKATNQEEKRQAIESTLKNYIAAEITQRWANDINLVVNQIPTWEKSTFLSNHLDTTKIGVFGHSQGGAAAGQALLNNAKISAGINIDGVQWGKMIDTFYAKPFLLLSSDWPVEHPDFNQFAFQNGSTADFYLAKIKQSGHASFMDISWMINLSAINEAGEIEPEKAIRITTQIVTEFFNKNLHHQEVDLLKLSKDHTALIIEKREKRPPY